MDKATFSTELAKAYEELPGRLREVARWILDHPTDVALLTTREQARRANLNPVAFTRLAQRLGFSGFDDVRQLFAEAVRAGPEHYRGRAEQLVARRDIEGDAALVQDTFAALLGHLRELSDKDSLERFTAAADRLAVADRVYCLGLRSSFSAAFLFHYVRTLSGAASVLADGSGGMTIDALRLIGPSDVLFVVSVRPYTKLTVEAAEFVRGKGATIVAITDTALSPLARLADTAILIRTDTPSFFHTMTPALAAAECLAALVAARRGRQTLAALKESEAQLSAFDTYVDPSRKARRDP